MRLRICVRRWGLPDTPILFALDTASSPLVSQLLELVNENVPIESGDWGLEDYVVELRGRDGVMYECLHYSKVTTVVKEDDEILIRPLVSQDIKERRMAGRLQISSAGQHLVDGVVFGRAKLRHLSRPAVNIPPRKRRRVTYDEVEAGEEEEEQEHVYANGLHDAEAALPILGDPRDDSPVQEANQLTLHGEIDSEDDEEDDEDFDPDDQSDDDSSEADSDEESEEAEVRLPARGKDVSRARATESKKSSTAAGDGKPIEDVKVSATSDDVRQLRVAFPDTPIAVIEHVLEASKNDLDKTYEALARGFRPALPRGAISVPIKPATARPLPGTLDDADSPDGSDEDSGDDDVAAEDPKLTYYDQNGLPPGSISTDSGKLKNIKSLKFASPTGAPRRTASASSEQLRSVRFVTNEEDEPKDTVISDTSSDSETSSSGVTESSSEDDSDFEADDDSTSSSSDDDGESSDDDDQSTPPSVTTSKDTSVKATALTVSESPMGTIANETTSKPPEAGRRPGKPSTKARNERRRLSNAMARYKSKGLLPANTTLAEFKALYPDRLSQCQSLDTTADQLRTSVMSSSADQGSLMDAVMEARRQQLLQSIANGGVDVSPSSSKPSIEDKAGQDAAPRADSVQETHTEHASKADEGTPRSPQASSARPTRRSLDTRATRRMILGGLGLGNPKTAADEKKLREKVTQSISKSISNTKQPRPLQEQPKKHKDVNSWRSAINYFAVECCHDGIVLSEPPFPFYQHWTKHQNPNTASGSKRKQAQREEPHYYEDTKPSSKKQKRRKGKNARSHNDFSMEMADAQTADLDYEEPSYVNHDESTISKTIGGADSQQHESHAPATAATGTNEVADDLVPLPDDVASLPDLRQANARVGMVIAFKQLEMINFEPQMSSYKTARIVYDTDAEILGLHLANRDRPVKEKLYDDHGNRVYGKFDVPDEDEDVEVEGDENPQSVVDLEVAISDLIDPKIVTADAGQSSPPCTAIIGDSKLKSTDFDPPTQYSHVSETQLQSTSQLQDAQILKPSMDVNAHPNLDPLFTMPSTKSRPNNVSSDNAGSAPSVDLDANRLAPDVSSPSLAAAHVSVPAQSMANMEVSGVETISQSPSITYLHGDKQSAEMSGLSGHEALADSRERESQDSQAAASQLSHNGHGRTRTSKLQTHSVGNTPVDPLTPAQMAVESFYNSVLAEPPSTRRLDENGGSHVSTPSAAHPIQSTIQTPHDSLALKQLLAEMTGSESRRTPDSPRFNGLEDPSSDERDAAPAGSTPTKGSAQHRSVTLADHTAQDPPPPSKKAVQFHSESMLRVSRVDPKKLLSSPITDSGWETVESDQDDQTLDTGTQQEIHSKQDSWITVTDTFPSSDARLPPSQRSETPRLETRNITAHDLGDTVSETVNDELPEQHVQTDKQTDVHYPKITAGSSFGSHVSDFGRQPDFQYEDTSETLPSHVSSKVETVSSKESRRPTKRTSRHVKQEDRHLGSSRNASIESELPEFDDIFSQASQVSSKPRAASQSVEKSTSSSGSADKHMRDDLVDTEPPTRKDVKKSKSKMARVSGRPSRDNSRRHLSSSMSPQLISASQPSLGTKPGEFGGSIRGAPVPASTQVIDLCSDSDGRTSRQPFSGRVKGGWVKKNRAVL